MNFVDMFYVELREVLKFGVLLFFVSIDLIFVLGGILSIGDWINRKFFINKFVIGKKGAGKERIDK